jgi:hypothetical protein
MKLPIIESAIRTFYQRILERRGVSQITDAEKSINYFQPVEKLFSVRKDSAIRLLNHELSVAIA